MAERRHRSGAGSALVLAAGDLPPPAVTAAVLRDHDMSGSFVVAADGGLAHAHALAVTPDLIVGDLDSAPPALLTAYAGTTVERHSVDKDELDLELALTAALARGARDVHVIGAFGDRLDHSLAALLVAARLARDGIRVALHGGRHSAWPLASGRRHALALPVGTVVSLVALADGTIASALGLRYAVAHLALPFGSGLGASNEVTAEAAWVACEGGLLAVIAEHGAP